MASKVIDFDLTAFPGCSVKSFSLRELTGADSLAAAQRSVSSNGGGNPVFGFQHRNQLVADAIVKVNGQDVPSPYVAWEDWNLRTQEFVTTAYDEMNGVTKDEMTDFLRRAGLRRAPTPGVSAPTT